MNSETTMRVGTADLLDMLKLEEPDSEFTFCMGADTFIDLTDWKWKRSRDVLRLLEGRIIVFQRPGGDELEERVGWVNLQEGGKVRIVHLNNEAHDVSSTLVRSILTRDKLTGLVPPAVEEFIIGNKLYGFSDFPS